MQLSTQVCKSSVWVVQSTIVQNTLLSYILSKLSIQISCCMRIVQRVWIVYYLQQFQPLSFIRSWHILEKDQQKN